MSQSFSRNREVSIQILVYVFFFCIACHQKHRIVEFRRNSEIMKMYFTNDSLGSLYMIRNYDLKGNLILETPFANGKKNGVSKTFYEDGTLRSSEFSIDDSLFGKSSFFDEQGRLESVSSFVNNKQCGETIFYDTTGKIDLYNFYDYDENVFSYVEMNSESNERVRDGLLFAYKFPIYSLSDRAFVNNCDSITHGEYLFIIPFTRLTKRQIVGKITTYWNGKKTDFRILSSFDSYWIFQTSLKSGINYEFRIDATIDSIDNKGNMKYHQLFSKKYYVN
jgi:hypothetical protein